MGSAPCYLWAMATRTFVLRVAVVAAALVLVGLMLLVGYNYSQPCKVATGKYSGRSGSGPPHHSLTALGACRR